MKRTQIYLDEQQDAELAERAAAEGRTKSELIREAVDGYLAGAETEEQRMARFRETIHRVAGTAPYLPPGEVYVRKMREADLARQEMLEKRWRG